MPANYRPGGRWRWWATTAELGNGWGITLLIKEGPAASANDGGNGTWCEPPDLLEASVVNDATLMVDPFAKRLWFGGPNSCNPVHGIGWWPVATTRTKVGLSAGCETGRRLGRCHQEGNTADAIQTRGYGHATSMQAHPWKSVATSQSLSPSERFRGWAKAGLEHQMDGRQ